MQVVEIRHFPSSYDPHNTFYSHESWWSMLPSRLHRPKSWWSIGSSGAMAPAPLASVTLNSVMTADERFSAVAGLPVCFVLRTWVAIVIIQQKMMTMMVMMMMTKCQYDTNTIQCDVFKHNGDQKATEVKSVRLYQYYDVTWSVTITVTVWV